MSCWMSTGTLKTRATRQFHAIRTVATRCGRCHARYQTRGRGTVRAALQVNTELWPDWTAFIDAIHTASVSPLNPVGAALRLMLNLHPQGGTDACQKNWPAFSAAINYTGVAIVPCTWGNQRIAAASFSTFMDADVLAAVDGWCEFRAPMCLLCCAFTAASRRQGLILISRVIVSMPLPLVLHAHLGLESPGAMRFSRVRWAS